MILQFLGTGDAFGSGGLDQTCFLLSSDDYFLLIDCGCSGLTSLKRMGIDPLRIDAIVVSHLHGDHFGGIPFFIRDQTFAGRKKTLLVVGPPDTEDRIELLSFFLFPCSKSFVPSFDIIFKNYTGEDILINEHGICIKAFGVDHEYETNPHAVRISINNKVICYSGDTTWNNALIEAAHEADIFICEAYTLNKAMRNHMVYSDINSNAKKLSCKKIFLTHCTEEVLNAADTLELEIARQGMTVNL